ncbi:MAG TPA: MCP four helix bundle domain-containing protein [Flavipsychrobacter sp.]|nr:MCP four helix bundle domain-containing protein [Flavipsychrobacter sp.]
MKWAYNIRHKLRAALGLTAISIIILLSNFFERKSFTNLDSSMNSIYQDRLMPASYLYEISNHLYQKRLSHESNAQNTEGMVRAKVAEHNAAIAAIITKYETTVLTKDETTQWAAFKNHLTDYNLLEEQWLHHYATPNATGDAMHLQVVAQFDKALANLNSLTKIQVGEGDNLQKTSHSIVSNTLLLSYLEISLLIVLSLFTLVILSTTDRVLFRNNQHQMLN